VSKQKTYELGTAIKITTILSLASPTSVKIKIKDAGNSTVVDSVAMTADTTSVYSYIYQSSTTGIEGEYIIIIDAVYGAYNSRAVSNFTLVDNDV